MAMQRPRRIALRKNPFASLAYALVRNGITPQHVAYHPEHHLAEWTFCLRDR